MADPIDTDACPEAAHHVEKIRDRVNLQLTAQRQADSNPDDQVAADAADDLLDDIGNNAILDVPFLLDEVDRLRAELTLIANCPAQDMVLDPTWARRIARHAVGRAMFGADQ